MLYGYNLRSNTSCLRYHTILQVYFQAICIFHYSDVTMTSFPGKFAIRGRCTKDKKFPYSVRNPNQARKCVHNQHSTGIFAGYRTNCLRGAVSPLSGVIDFCHLKGDLIPFKNISSQIIFQQLHHFIIANYVFILYSGIILRIAIQFTKLNFD